MESFKCSPDIDCSKQKHIDALLSRNVITLKEACSFFNISMRYIRKKINNNEIPSIKVGKFIRIPTKNLTHMIYCNQETATSHEIANYLKVSNNTITKLIEEKKIMADLFNNKWLISAAEFKRFLEEKTSI